MFSSSIEKQTIILAPGASEADLLKTLSLFKINTFNVHVFNSIELARYALEKNGIFSDTDFIADNFQAYPTFDDITDLNFFSKFTLPDIVQFMSELNKLRKYIVDEDESEAIDNKLTKDTFKGKNNDIKAAFEMYKSYLADRSLVDEIDIIRDAIKNICVVDANFVCLKEFPLKPLELELLKVVSNNNYKCESLSDFDKPLRINSYTKAFGVSNEIENVLSYISKNKIPLDQCLIVAPDATMYFKILNNYKNILSYDVIGGVSQSILSTVPGMMFSNVYKYFDFGFFPQYFIVLIGSDSFNKNKLQEDIEFKETSFGKVKVTFDSVIKFMAGFPTLASHHANAEPLKLLQNSLEEQIEKGEGDLDQAKADLLTAQYAEKISYKLFKDESLVTLFNNYAICKSPEDNNALQIITDILSTGDSYDIDIFEVLLDILTKAVGKQAIKPGCLYVTNIRNAVNYLRPYVFLVGMSSNNFPGGYKENSIFLDEDYLCFGVNKNKDNEVIDNINCLSNFISFANTYCKEIHVSYPSYDSSTLKKQSPSSGLFKIFTNENGHSLSLNDFTEKFKNPDNKYKVVEFFDSKLFKNDFIGEAYNSNKEIVPSDYKEKTEEHIDIQTNKLDKEFSPTSIECYVNCQYKFFLKYVLDIPDYEDDNFDKYLPENELGTIAHNALSKLDKNIISLDEFLLESKKYLDRYTLKKHDPIPTLIDEIYLSFERMMTNAYEMEGKNEVLLAEQSLSCVHKETGIKLYGKPDKVIRTDDGYKIIDYKTSNKIKHTLNDPKTLIQGIIYAYLVQNKYPNLDVTGFDFRYIKLHKDIVSSDMKDNYDVLTEVLNNLKNSLEKGNFEYAENKSICKFCPYSIICKGCK